MKIKVLDETHYQKTVEVKYETNYYFDMIITKGREFKMVRKVFPEPTIKTMELTLNELYVDNPISYGLFDGTKLVGFIELGEENWNNRLRITNIYIVPEYLKQGWGSKLVDKAVQHAKDNNYRLLVLETQSCNYPAIMFYEKLEFEITGFDLNHYTNEDVKRKEYRIEMSRKV